MLASTIAKKPLVVIAGLALSALIIGILFFGITLYYVVQSMAAIEDPSEYSRIIKAHKEAEPSLVSHFPAEIPGHARNVKFYYQPAFMQGGSVLQLRMQLAPVEIERIREQIKPRAVRRYVPGGDANSPLVETSPDGSYTVNYEYSSYTGTPRNGETVGEPFPKDYGVYVLHDTRGPPTYDWNHPELYGVAFNEATSEVVYWMEDR
jgi:hypothetical protein